MEQDGSVPYSRESITCPYPEPDESSPCLLSMSLQDIF